MYGIIGLGFVGGAILKSLKKCATLNSDKILKS